MHRTALGSNTFAVALSEQHGDAPRLRLTLRVLGLFESARSTVSRGPEADGGRARRTGAVGGEKAWLACSRGRGVKCKVMGRESFWNGGEQFRGVMCAPRPSRAPLPLKVRGLRERRSYSGGSEKGGLCCARAALLRGGKRSAVSSVCEGRSPSEWGRR